MCFKVRWIVKEYFQQFEVDFDQTFAAVVKLMIFQPLFAITACNNLNVEQINIKI